MSTHRDVKLASNRANHSIRQNPLLLDIARRGDENSDRLHETTPRFDGVPDHRHHLQEFGWTLEASRRVFLKEHLKENDEGLRDTCELFNRQGDDADADPSPQRQSPGMASGPSASPRASRQASRDPNGCLRPGSRELLGTRELWCPCKNSGQ